jgi:hypothetical protein
MNILPVAEPDSMPLRKLQDENRLLFEQLRLVQEELERLHWLPGNKVKSIQNTLIQVAPVDGRFLQIAADNLRYQTLLETQNELHDLQTNWALAGQLGEILIEGTRSAGSLLSVPNRLHKAWRLSRRTAPPAEWGGKSFDKVIRAYSEGGEERVRALISQAPVANAVKASAWTALARTLMTAEPARAAMMAGLAFALEPRGFRQKWLAFRLHEAGDLAKADAWLTLLPPEVTFTDSERRQKERLLIQAEEYRQEQARQIHEIDAQQKQLQHQWEELAQSRDSLAAVALSQDNQIGELQNQIRGLRHENATQAACVSQLQQERQSFEHELALVGREQAAAGEKNRQQQQQLDVLGDELTVCQQSIREQRSLVAESQRERDVLIKTLATVEHALCSEKEHVVKWLEQCRVLQSALADLTQEKDHLRAQCLQQGELLESLQLEVATLQSKLNERAEQADQDQKLIQALNLQVDNLTVSHDAQCAVVLKKEAEYAALQVNADSLMSDLEKQKTLALQWESECVTVQTALESLQSLYEEQTQVAVQRLARCESVQEELNVMSRAYAEQAALAAQRQGELLQQSRELLSHETAKEVLSLKTVELEKKLATQMERETGLIRGLSKQVQALAAREVVSPQMLQELFQTRAEEVTRVHQQIEATIQKNTTNTIRQVQSFIGMQEYFATGVLPAFNSEAHSWPVSADFALCVMQRVVLEHYDLVIEFGSGMSTVVVAKTLALRAEREPLAKTHFVSFDHLDSYYQQTLGYLKQSGVESLVQLVLAPLEDWLATDGQAYPYYSCQKVLAQLAKQRAGVKKRILVIVDGPPAATGPHARYPAGPIVMQHFPNSQIDFLMDDYIRQDEKEVAKQWQHDVKAAGLSSAVRSYKFEKDACLITVHPKDLK